MVWFGLLGINQLINQVINQYTYRTTLVVIFEPLINTGFVVMMFAAKKANLFSTLVLAQTYCATDIEYICRIIGKIDI